MRRDDAAMSDYRPSLLILLLLLLLTACGDDPAPEVEVPSWAKVAPEQIAEAKKRRGGEPSGPYKTGTCPAQPRHSDDHSEAT